MKNTFLKVDIVISYIKNNVFNEYLLNKIHNHQIKLEIYVTLAKKSNNLYNFGVEKSCYLFY